MRAIALSLGFVLVCGSALATNYYWDFPLNGDWSNTNKWTAAGYPDDIGDSATISVEGARYTVTLDRNPSLASFTLASDVATFFNHGHAMSTPRADYIRGTAILDYNTFKADRMLIGPDAVFRVYRTSFLRSYTNGDRLNLTQRGTLHLSAEDQSSVLTVSDGFLNEGHIRISGTNGYAAQLKITEGALTNAETGQIDFEYSGGGYRLFRAGLVNHGMVNMRTDISFEGDCSNSAAFNIATNTTLNFRGSGDSVFTQAGGSLNNQGTFLLSSKQFDFTGGTIIGNPITIITGTLNIGPLAGEGGFIFRNYCDLSGNVASNQHITIESKDGYDASVSTYAGFINSGKISLTRAGSVGRSSLRMIDCVLTNAASGIIETLPGDGGNRYLRGTTVNYGLLDIYTYTGLDTYKSSLINHGLIHLHNGKKIRPYGTDINVTNMVNGRITGTGIIDASHTGTSFINAGTIAPDTITIKDHYYTRFRQTDTGRLEIKVGPAGQGMLIVDGKSQLAGTVDMQVDEGHTIAPGESFTILTADLITDNGLTLDPEDAADWMLHISPTSVVAEAIAAPAVTARGTQIAWLEDYGFINNFEAVDEEDQDHDGQFTWQEYIAGTDPTNAASRLCIEGIENFPPAIYFTPSSNRLYSMVYCTNLITGPWYPLSGGIEQSDSPFIDTNETDGVRYYSLKVKMAE